MSHGNQNKFLLGDKARVTSGEMQNVVGKIVSLSGNYVSLKPASKQLRDVVEVPVNQVCKEFALQEHTKVVAGRHLGKTGTVIALDYEKGWAKLLTDNQNVIEVRINDMSVSGEVKFEQIDNGLDLKKYDLIKILSYNGIGVVL